MSNSLTNPTAKRLSIALAESFIEINNNGITIGKPNTAIKATFLILEVIAANKVNILAKPIEPNTATAKKLRVFSTGKPKNKARTANVKPESKIKYRALYSIFAAIISPDWAIDLK